MLLLVLMAACKKQSTLNENPENASSPSLVNAKIGDIPSVIICNQTWMKDNLDVTTYSNGDAIPQVSNPAAWFSLTTGAWCYYNNDPKNGGVYGKLYNWYAVNDVRGIAPLGWHVPSDAEWTTLTDCLGGTTIAGGKLKDRGTKFWNVPNTGATNSSRFTAFPGGNLNSIDGIFINRGLVAYYWTATTFSFNAAYSRSLLYNSATVGTFGAGIISDGFSVRCVKD